MAGSLLVALDLAVAEKAIRALEEGGIPLKVGLWMTTTEDEDGRIVIASNSFDPKQVMKSYQRVVDLLREKVASPSPTFSIRRLNDPFVKALRKRFGKVDGEGRRIRNEFIGDTFIPDGYVYRIR